MSRGRRRMSRVDEQGMEGEQGMEDEEEGG